MQNLMIAERLEKGEIFNGIWRTMSDDAITEIVARAGYDFQVFDLEHGALSWSDIQRMIRVNNALNRASFVRLGDRSPVSAQRALDCGAHGLVYPGINSVEDISILAENFSFAPDGRRGYNPFVPAFGYGEHKASDGIKPLFIPIVETRSGLDSIKAIASHPSVDIVYLGAYDLSVQLGTPGDIGSRVVQDAITSAVELCVRSGCAVGLMVNTPGDRETWTRRGVQVLLHGVDAGLVRKAFELQIK